MESQPQNAEFRYDPKNFHSCVPSLVPGGPIIRASNFLISQPKHMLWVLKRTVSMRRFIETVLLSTQNLC